MHTLNYRKRDIRAANGGCQDNMLRTLRELKRRGETVLFEGTNPSYSKKVTHRWQGLPQVNSRGKKSGGGGEGTEGLATVGSTASTSQESASSVGTVRCTGHRTGVWRPLHPVCQVWVVRSIQLLESLLCALSFSLLSCVVPHLSCVVPAIVACGAAELCPSPYQVFPVLRSFP